MDFRLPFEMTLRPIKGFWEMKYEKRGSMKIAFIIMVAYIVTQILYFSFAGFIVNASRLENINIIWITAVFVLPFVLFTISNWCITTLMQGEGNYKDICMATAYALAPIIIIHLPLIPISNFITLYETAFYFFFYSFAIFWFLVMLFLGIMTVHQYTVAKTIGTFLLTILMMGIIVYIMLLLFSLGQQIYVFFSTIYEEVRLR